VARIPLRAVRFKGRPVPRPLGAAFSAPTPVSSARPSPACPRSGTRRAFSCSWLLLLLASPGLIPSP